MKRAGTGFLAVVALIVGLFSLTAMAQTPDVKVQNAVSIFQSSEVTHPYFEHAYGFAVFPTVGKGGFILGGAYGTGKVFRQGELSGLSSLAQLSIGFQAGLQAYSEIIFFQDERAYKEFISGTFEFDATASAVAVTAGAQAQTGTMGASAGYSAGPKTSRQEMGAYYKGLAVFTHAKGGLMLEASVAGQKFNFKPQQYRTAAR
ncbi:MAG: YSC84-related protein [Pseudomonadales bacterium]